MNNKVKSEIEQMLRDSFAFAKECSITFDEECDCIDVKMTFDYGIKLEVGIFDDMDCITLVSRNESILGQYTIEGIDTLSAIMVDILNDIKCELPTN